MNNTKCIKNPSFFYKKVHSLYSNLVNLQNAKCLLNRLYKNEITYDSLTSTYNKVNSLNKTQRTTKDSKFIHNISSPSINNYKSKFNNFYDNCNNSQKNFQNSVINNRKNRKIFKILSQNKKYKSHNDNNNDNSGSQASLKNESNLKIQNNKNHLKLSSEFNYIKDYNASSSKREIYKKENRTIKYCNNALISKLTPNLLNNKTLKKFNNINKEMKNNDSFSNKPKHRFSSIISRNKNNQDGILENENKLKNNNLYDLKNKKENKKPKKLLSKDSSMKLCSKYISSNNKNNLYLQNYSKKIFIEKSKVYNKEMTKRILSNYKNKIMSIIKNNNLNKSFENSDKKITVNLKNENFKIKKNKKKTNINININVVGAIPLNNKNNENNNFTFNHSQSQIIFSPLSSKFTKSHENSISILSSKNIIKKSNLSNRNSKLSNASSNKIRCFNNLKGNLNETNELKDIVNLMKRKLQEFNKKTDNYLNGEKNYFVSPDGPEDFHFRFVELCRQNNSFYKNLHFNIINQDKRYKIKQKKIEDNNVYDFQGNFENFNDDVPYI